MLTKRDDVFFKSSSIADFPHHVWIVTSDIGDTEIRLQLVQLRHDPALRFQRDDRNSGMFNVFHVDILVYSAMNPRSDGAVEPRAAKIKAEEFGRVIRAETEPN